MEHQLVSYSRKSEIGNTTVTLAHSRTRNLASICGDADILVVAIGKPAFVNADMVKEGAVVIDVGIHRIKDATKKMDLGLLVMSIFDEVAPKSSYITPVPGGVGPMTIASLLQNTFKSAYEKN